MIEPAEADLLRHAAARLLEGDSMHSVVTGWNDSGVTTRFGKHWRQSNLRTIFLDPSIIGETKAGVAGWEPIVDRRTYDRIGRIFNDPARKVTHSPGVRGGKYSMGGGLTVCATCGNRLISAGKRLEAFDRDSPVRRLLKCTKFVNGPTACNSNVVDHDLLESFVFETLIASFAQNERWQQRLGEKAPDVDARIDLL